MIFPITASKIYSTLGNPDSLIPMAIKDTANSLGLTAGSYITGKDAESQDRFIDEFGTQAIWLLGIPTYKKILDLVLFRSIGLDAGVDARVLKDQAVFELAKKYAKEHDEKFKTNPKVKKIAQSLEKITSKQKLFKGLTFGKFVASTALTIISYGALTDFRQKYREEKIKKDFYEKHSQKKKENNSTILLTKSKTFDSIHKKTNKEIKFTGKLEDFMFSPVKNLMIVDGSITTERIAKSQNKQEFMGYVLKEGFFWFFMYFAGERIKAMLENSSLKKRNIPISLDARAIESEELRKALLNNKIMQSIYEFPASNNPTNAEIYKFVNENPDNLIVKMGKISGLIKTVKGTEAINEQTKKVVEGSGSIDNRKYIDPDEIKGLKDKLIMLYEKGEEFVNREAETLKAKLKSEGKEFAGLSAEQKVEILTKYLDKVKKGNRAATIKNIGACIGFLGILLPAMIVGWRFMDKENKEYKVRTEIEKKLKAEMAAKNKIIA